MNAEIKKRGANVTDEQLALMKTHKAKTAKQLKEFFTDELAGVAVDNIGAHLSTWRKHPEDTIAEHKEHFLEDKGCRKPVKKEAEKGLLRRDFLRCGMIVSWPFAGEIATGVIDEVGYVIVAVNYRMDSNVGPNDLWYQDSLYTDFETFTTDWSLVRPATPEERRHLFAQLTSLESICDYFYNERQETPALGVDLKRIADALERAYPPFPGPTHELI